MHVFLYEWITGGGLVEQPGSLPTSLLTEGAAMLTALAADFAAIEHARVTVLRDLRLDDLQLPDCEVIEVHSADHRREEIARFAATADHTLVIAPEFDDLLLETLQQARQAGDRLMAASEEFVALTGNKHETAECLTNAGVPVPEARLLASDEERMPADFVYPSVLKPIQGAGSQHTLLMASARDEPPPYPWPRRLERYCQGIPASVAFLCGPRSRVPLPACQQHLTTDGRFSYLGGSLLQEADLVGRATDLADRALGALPAAFGYVGVDLVLGKAADGSEDYVIEVNPRVTTSYVGLRAATESNLAAAMLDIAAGRPANLSFRDAPLEFSSDGAIRNPIH